MDRVRAWLVTAAVSLAAAAAIAAWAWAQPPARPAAGLEGMRYLPVAALGYLAFCFGLTALVMAWLERRGTRRAP